MSWFCNSEEAKEHKRTCTKNSWECGKCIWIDESSNAMSEYGTFVEKEVEIKPVKQIQAETENEWDILAKNVIKDEDYSNCDHPLLPEILKVFKK
tara:strand:+ start:2415 stop:2699 length:285 start_codon:yes stop_codon:yes gene_type:complete